MVCPVRPNGASHRSLPLLPNGLAFRQELTFSPAVFQGHGDQFLSRIRISAVRSEFHQALGLALAEEPQVGAKEIITDYPHSTGPILITGQPGTPSSNQI